MRKFLSYFIAALLVFSCHFSAAQFLAVDPTWGYQGNYYFTYNYNNDRLIVIGDHNSITKDIYYNSYALHETELELLTWLPMYFTLQGAVDAQGRILIAGYYDSLGSAINLIQRLLPNGSLDSTFGTNGSVAFSIANGGPLVIVPTVSGYFIYQSNGFNGLLATILKLDLDGQFDPNWNYQGTYLHSPTGVGAYLNTDVSGGPYLISLGTSQIRGSLVHINPDGSLDPGFQALTVLKADVQITSSGRIIRRVVIPGQENELIFQGHLPNGTIDQGYGINGFVQIGSGLLASDCKWTLTRKGKILVAASGGSIPGQPVGGHLIWAINENGQPDGALLPNGTGRVSMGTLDTMYRPEYYDGKFIFRKSEYFFSTVTSTLMESHTLTAVNNSGILPVEESQLVSEINYTGDLGLILELKQGTRAKMTVQDLAGKTISSQDFGFLPPGTHTLQCERVDQLSNGVYIISLETTAGIMNRKVFKMAD